MTPWRVRVNDAGQEAGSAALSSVPQMREEGLILCQESLLRPVRPEGHSDPGHCPSDIARPPPGCSLWTRHQGARLGAETGAHTQAFAACRTRVDTEAGAPWGQAADEHPTPKGLHPSASFILDQHQDLWRVGDRVVLSSINCALQNYFLEQSS